VIDPDKIKIELPAPAFPGIPGMPGIPVNSTYPRHPSVAHRDRAGSRAAAIPASRSVDAAKRGASQDAPSSSVPSPPSIDIGVPRELQPRPSQSRTEQTSCSDQFLAARDTSAALRSASCGAGRDASQLRPSMTKKPTTYATVTCQPPTSQRPADLASGYMLASATPADEQTRSSSRRSPPRRPGTPSRSALLEGKRVERDVVEHGRDEAQAQRRLPGGERSLSTGIIEAHVTSASRKMVH